jgi:flagellin
VSEFSFNAGASLASIISDINGRKDATGVEAIDDAGTLKLQSTTYGTKSFVEVKVISGTTTDFGAGFSAARTTGTDIVATINGTNATGDGNTLSVNTSTLNLSLTVADGSSTTVNFEINGGGALFQLGGDVVSTQQARLGIQSLSTSSLGGVSGRLFELKGGNAKALSNDIAGASKVIDEVINKVTGIRGRLGAFQRTTLESNLVSLTDTVTNLTEAQSSIRDADFAKESANLTRAQILVQSGTSVLGIANQSSQNVLALLR